MHFSEYRCIDGSSSVEFFKFLKHIEPPLDLRSVHTKHNRMANQRLKRTLVLIILALLRRAKGCYIGHIDSGECVKARYVLEGKLEFCGQGYSWFELHPDYEVCVPMETVK